MKPLVSRNEKRWGGVKTVLGRSGGSLQNPRTKMLFWGPPPLKEELHARRKLACQGVRFRNSPFSAVLVFSIQGLLKKM